MQNSPQHPELLSLFAPLPAVPSLAELEAEGVLVPLTHEATPQYATEWASLQISNEKGA